MTDLVERLVDKLMGISIPQMEGDNLAVTICSYFEDPDDTPDDDTGWTPAAIKAYEDLKTAISEHFSPLSNRITVLEAEIARKDALLEKVAQAAIDASASLAYITCASGRHVTLGDACETAIRALSPKAIVEGVK